MKDLNFQWGPVAAFNTWLTTASQLRINEIFPATFRWCCGCDWGPQNRPFMSRSNWNMHAEVGPASPFGSTEKHQRFMNSHSFQKDSQLDLSVGTPSNPGECRGPGHINLLEFQWVSLFVWTVLRGRTFDAKKQECVKGMCEVSEHP